MENAAARAAEWFKIITEIKKEKGLISDEGKELKYGGLIGLEYSETTTTLGSLDAKITAANPDFAALTIRWLNDLKIDSNKTVAVVISGSFPSLAICVLAALQELNAKVVLISSLGASSYGANDPNATWADMESWLRNKGALKYKSNIVSLGAEDDNGTGLMDEGVEALKKAAERNGVQLFIPKDFEESYLKKKKLLDESKTDLLINIGGNQVAMGACPHGVSIPNGVHKKLKYCNDKNRGLIFDFAEKGIPVIHFLNIKSLAAEYGMPIMPKVNFEKSSMVYNTSEENRWYAGVSIFIIFILLIIGRERTRKNIRKQ